MLGAGKLALTVLAGGTALGALLGALADPVMKAPPEQWWQLSARPEPASDYPFDDEPWPVSLPDGFRPDLDYGVQVAEYWLPPLAEWSFEDPAPLPEVAELDAELVQDMAFPADEPAIPHYAALEAAAAAEDAAGDALAADTAAPPPSEAPTPEHRVAGLQTDGLW